MDILETYNYQEITYEDHVLWEHVLPIAMVLKVWAYLPLGGMPDLVS